MPKYFDYYINLMADVELSQAFTDSIQQLNELDKDLLMNLGGRSYAPDKWTVKGILQHIIDFEESCHTAFCSLPEMKVRFRKALTKSCWART